MKKFPTSILSCALAIMLLTGCGAIGQAESEAPPGNTSRESVPAAETGQPESKEKSTRESIEEINEKTTVNVSGTEAESLFPEPAVVSQQAAAAEEETAAAVEQKAETTGTAEDETETTRVVKSEAETTTAAEQETEATRSAGSETEEQTPGPDVCPATGGNHVWTDETYTVTTYRAFCHGKVRETNHCCVEWFYSTKSQEDTINQWMDHAIEAHDGDGGYTIVSPLTETKYTGNQVCSQCGQIK